MTKINLLEIKLFCMQCFNHGMIFNGVRCLDMNGVSWSTIKRIDSDVIEKFKISFPDVAFCDF